MKVYIIEEALHNYIETKKVYTSVQKALSALLKSFQDNQNAEIKIHDNDGTYASDVKKFVDITIVSGADVCCYPYFISELEVE